jgi:hypothetical protein
MTPIEVPNESSRRRRKGAWGLMFGVLIFVTVGLALWSWLALAWSYSEGERAGIVQKFSRRGWVCKTYEGELAQYVVAGVTPQIWYFSVRNEAVAQQLNKLVGRPVQMRYSEHAGVPSSCFADTRYFVDRVTLMSDVAPKP